MNRIDIKMIDFMEMSIVHAGDFERLRQFNVSLISKTRRFAHHFPYKYTYVNGCISFFFSLSFPSALYSLESDDFLLLSRSHNNIKISSMLAFPLFFVCLCVCECE